MIFLGYFVELIIFIVWKKCILEKELGYKKIIRRSIQIFFRQRQNIVRFIFEPEMVSQDQKEDFSSIISHILDIFAHISLIMGCFVLAPIFLKDIVKDKEITGNLFYIILLCGIILAQLKEKTQRIIESVKLYIQDVMVPLEKITEIPNLKHAERDTSKRKKEKIMIFVACLISITAWMFLIIYFKDNKVFQFIEVILFIVIIVWMIISSIPVRVSADEGIYVEGYILESIKEDILRMCSKLKIKNLKCIIINTNDRYAKSKINENGVPQIEISNGFISMIYGDEARNILIITIAHELGHIYYNDFNNIKKRLKWANLIYLLLMLVDIFAVLKLKIYLTVMLVIIVIESVLGYIMCDIRYWEQIAELRADRLAINVCQYNINSFIEFWRNNSKNKRNEKTNIIDQYYRRYIKIEGHPTMERRLKLMEKRKKWKWWEYFEHALIIIKWRITNRGWNGI